MELDRIIADSVKRSVKQQNEIMEMEYNSLIKSNYLKEFLIFGECFTVTDVRFEMEDVSPSVNFNGSVLSIKSRIRYTWYLTLSLSFKSKVTLEYEEFRQLESGNASELTLTRIRNCIQLEKGE